MSNAENYRKNTLYLGVMRNNNELQHLRCTYDAYVNGDVFKFFRTPLVHNSGTYIIMRVPCV